MGNQLWPIFKAQFSKSNIENWQVEQATAQVSGFANTSVNKANNGYHIETTAAIQILVEKTKMDRIHVANLVAENTNLTRTIKTITT